MEADTKAGVGLFHIDYFIIMLEDNIVWAFKPNAHAYIISTILYLN